MFGQITDHSNPHVKIMAVGQSKQNFPPSLNLIMDPYKGSLKDYMKNVVKRSHDSGSKEWKDLGNISTNAGPAQLIQYDIQTNWGEVRSMQVILLKNEMVYILTASALKEEFPQFYNDFFTSLRSLYINKTLIEMISNPTKRALLEKTFDKLELNWQLVLEKGPEIFSNLNHEELKKALFESQEFQIKYWLPFKELLETDYKEMGSDWQYKILLKMKGNLIES